MNPSNTDAERHIVAGMIQQPLAAIPKLLSDGIMLDYFTDHRCRQLFPIIMELFDSGRELHIPLIHQQPELETIADEYLRHDISEIKNRFCGMELFTSYLPLIRKNHASRLVHKYANAAAAMVEMGDQPEDVAQKLRDGAEKASMVLTPTSLWKTAEQACDEFSTQFTDLQESDGEPGIQTGMDELDSHTGGMRKGELWVVSGQTSGGKSVMALQFVGSAIKQSRRAAIFSLEMMAEENIARMVASSRNVNYKLLRNPKLKFFDPETRTYKGLTAGDRENIKLAINDMKGSRMVICDEAGLTIERIDAMCQEMSEKEPLELIVIDYIQLILTTRKGEPRHEELSWIAGAMKQMAKKYKCPVITASQLNLEGRMAKAKSIGDDADVALRIEGADGIYVLKNRNGEKHMHLPFTLKGEYQRFESK